MLADRDRAAEPFLDPSCCRKMIGMRVGLQKPVDRDALGADILHDRFGRGGRGTPRSCIIVEHTVDHRAALRAPIMDQRSEEHTSELQSLMRNSYAVFCLKKKKYNSTHTKK